MIKQSLTRLCRLTAVAVLLCAGAVRAQDLASQIPSSANAAATVDVKALLASPLGQKEAWQSKLMGNYAERPLAVPAYATRLALAGMLELPTLSPMWQLSVIDVSVKADLGKVARDQRGVIDTIDGKVAVTTPFHVTHVIVGDQRIATLFPGQRQLAARLLHKESISRGASDYLAAALKADAANQIVLALDLNEAFSGASIRKTMAMGGLASLDSAEDVAKISDALATVKGVTVRVKIDSAVNVKMTADFATAVPIPAAAVEGFAKEMLGAAGLPVEEFAGLKFSATGNQIVGEGTTSVSAVSSLLALLVPDSQTTTLASAVAPADAPSNAPSPTAKSPAEASKNYFTAVAGTIDRLRSSTSMSANATQLRGAARSIQQVPILNVDPELTTWGAGVVEKLNDAAMVLTVGQQNAQNAASSIEAPVAEATYSESGYSSTDTSASRAAFRNAQQDRRRAAQEQRTAANEQVFRMLADTGKERNELRAKMTAKYGVEF